MPVAKVGGKPKMPTPSELSLKSFDLRSKIPRFRRYPVADEYGISYDHAAAVAFYRRPRFCSAFNYSFKKSKQRAAYSGPCINRQA